MSKSLASVEVNRQGMDAANLLTGMIAIDFGWITSDQLEECVRTQEAQLDPSPLGEVLCARGFLRPEQRDRLLEEQRRRIGEYSEVRLIGQIAVDRGFITEKQLGECLRTQLRRRPEERSPLGMVMVEKGYLGAERLAEVMAEQGKVSETLRPRDLRRDRPTSVWTTVGKFRILREIARGKMGIVFEAVDVSANRTVALKVLKEGDASPEAVARLRREGKIAAALRHPNIVAVRETCRIGEVHYLAMDFVAGWSLLEYLRRKGSEPYAVSLLLETIARAVHFAHLRGVVHRDLKPSNILVTSGGHPFVTDFGLAKAQAEAAEEGVVFGTPYYMSPEQIRGPECEVDARSDVYSLGVILYEILTGRVPFSGPSTADVYRRILSGEAARPAHLGRSIPAPLEAIVMKAMDRDRDLRYSSAEELARALARFREGDGTSGG